MDLAEVVRADEAETRVREPIGEAIPALVTRDLFEHVGRAPNRFIVRASRSSP